VRQNVNLRGTWETKGCAGREKSAESLGKAIGFFSSIAGPRYKKDGPGGGVASGWDMKEQCLTPVGGVKRTASWWVDLLVMRDEMRIKYTEGAQGRP